MPAATPTLSPVLAAHKERQSRNTHAPKIATLTGAETTLKHNQKHPSSSIDPSFAQKWARRRRSPKKTGFGQMYRSEARQPSMERGFQGEGCERGREGCTKTPAIQGRLRRGWGRMANSATAETPTAEQPSGSAIFVSFCSSGREMGFGCLSAGTGMAPPSFAVGYRRSPGPCRGTTSTFCFQGEVQTAESIGQGVEGDWNGDVAMAALGLLFPLARDSETERDHGGKDTPGGPVPVGKYSREVCVRQNEIYG